MYTAIEMPGLRGILYSRPCHGPEGGDVHFASVCGSGLVARLCVADVAGHGQVVAAVGREMHAHLRQSVNRFDDRRVMADLDRRLETEGLRALPRRPRQLLPSEPAADGGLRRPSPGWLYRAAEDRWTRLDAAPVTAGLPRNLPLGTGLGPDYSRQRLRRCRGDRVLS